MAACLNFAQFLPSFTSQHKSWLTICKSLRRFHGETGATLHQIGSKKGPEQCRTLYVVDVTFLTATLLDPWAVRGRHCFEFGNRVGFLHSQTDIVQTFQQALLFEGIHIEFDHASI